MTTAHLLDAQRLHLAGMLEAVQRCVYFLEASHARWTWPLRAEWLHAHRKDTDLFESLAAINERFAKLQDTLGAAMRHSLQLSGEQADSFLKLLTLYEKHGVVESVESWQVCRAARNLAAHDYETDYGAVADHFNTLHDLTPFLFRVAKNFLDYCAAQLQVDPRSADFADEFKSIVGRR